MFEETRHLGLHAGERGCPTGIEAGQSARGVRILAQIHDRMPDLERNEHPAQRPPMRMPLPTQQQTQLMHEVMRARLEPLAESPQISAPGGDDLPAQFRAEARDQPLHPRGNTTAKAAAETHIATMIAMPLLISASGA